TAKNKDKEKKKGSDDKKEDNTNEKKKKTTTSSAEDELEDVVTMEKWLKGRDLEEAHNTPAKIKEREKALEKMKLQPTTFLSRFPPEPNGFLHIGHCKAITFNFGLAESHHGHCYLRFDDTNPATEEQVYIDNIIENVNWMGFKPWKTTFSSDYFEEMYQLAIKMIKDDNAY
ncbi:glutamine-tRNA ligase, partial [Reticulomyxa filosa]